MRLIAAAALLVAAVGACGDKAGTVFGAADEATSFLEHTAADVVASRSYDLEVGSPTSAWCDEPDGTPDHSMLAVRQQLDFDLQPGDDPVMLAIQIVEYWEQLGHEVTAEGWGSSSFAGVSRNDRGEAFGVSAIDDGDGTFDVLQLSSFTTCYPTP